MTANGSYRLSALENSVAEKDRLNAQASFMWNEELRVLARYGAVLGASVLDLGCGTGEISRRLAEQVGGDGRVVGVDADPNILPQTPPASPMSFITARAGALPDSLGVFDLVYARFLLQHLPDPLSTLRNAVPRLAPNGRIAILDSDDGLILHHPHDEELSSLLARAETRQREAGGDRRIGRKLPSLLHAAGFRLEAFHVRTLTSADTPFPLLFRLACGYKASLVGESDRIGQIGKRLEARVGAHDFFFATGVCLAVGTL